MGRSARLSHRDIAVLAYSGLGTFELGIVVEIFGLPRPEFSEWYSFKVCGLQRGALKATGGLKIVPQEGIDGLAKAGTIIIPGWRTDEQPPEHLVQTLIRAHALGARLVSICSGVFVVAATGLLNGRRATTHWLYTAKLAQKYPRIRVEPDVLYVDEGDILTSAGSAAGIDLCLHIVRRDFGARIANRVARRLVVYPHREGGQAQFIERAVGNEDSPWFSELLEWAQRHIEEELPVERLAAQAGMSKRTLARHFTEATGTSPADWIISLRVSRAKELLETTSRTIEEIATDSGFGSAPTLRHHFRERVKISPLAYRSHFRQSRLRLPDR
jgi:AraC family transcriptional activator FtrA